MLKEDFTGIANVPSTLQLYDGDGWVVGRESNLQNMTSRYSPECS